MTTTVSANIDPFAFLGTDVSECDTIDSMLTEAGAGFTAREGILTVTTENGVFDVDGHRAIYRDDTDEVLAVHTKSYVPIQYAEVMEYCLDAVNLRPSDAAIENVGVMRGGAQFFATVNLGSLFIDPAGANDEIARYLAVFSSHDGSFAITLAETNLRIACMNQAPAVKAEGRTRITVKHTKNARERLSVAQSALGIADRAAAIFERQAQELMAQPCNKDTVVRVANKIWPLKSDATDKGKTQHANRLGKLVSIFEGPSASGCVGANKWAAYNAFTEYMDHGRGLTEEKRALASVVPGNYVESTKLQAGAYLLN